MLAIRETGNWSTVSDPSIRRAGAWVPIQGVWIMKAGTWEPVWLRLAAPGALAAVDASSCTPGTLGDPDIESYALFVSWTITEPGTITRVYRDGVAIMDAAAGVTSFTDDLLNENTDYTYQVSSVDTATDTESPLSAGVVGHTATNICGP